MLAPSAWSERPAFEQAMIMSRIFSSYFPKLMLISTVYIDIYDINSKLTHVMYQLCMAGRLRCVVRGFGDHSHGAVVSRGAEEGSKSSAAWRGKCLGKSTGCFPLVIADIAIENGHL